MFREKYKKDNEQILASAELVARTKAKMMKNEHGAKKRFVFRTSIAITAACAVVCLCVFGNSSRKIQIHESTPPAQTVAGENFFQVTAYAAELVADETVDSQRRLEFEQAANDDEPTLSIAVSERVEGEGELATRKVSFYKNIAFKCEGSNIKSVTFSVDEGYFSKMDEGQPLKRIGESYTMDGQDLDSVIYWGIDLPGELEMKNGEITYTFGGESKSFQHINVKAVATFEDGETQEKSIVYDTAKGTLEVSEK